VIGRRQNFATIQLAEPPLAYEDLSQAFDNAPIGIAWADMAGRLVRVNPVLYQMLGRSRDELVGCLVQNITYAEDIEPSEEVFARARQGESTFRQIQKRYRHADGHAVWTEVTVSVIRDVYGEARYVVAQVQDTTGRRSATRELADQVTFVEAVLENLDSGVVACDAQGRVTQFNRVSREMHGVPLQAVLPQEWAESYGLCRPDGITPLPLRENPLFRALSGETVRDDEVVIGLKDAEPRTVLVNGHSISDGDGELLGAVVVVHDVTDRRRTEAALTRLALYDPLTDLANRALLHDRLEHAIARQMRQPGPLALLLLDLDGFKLVNDSLGHQAGDGLLVALAGRLRSCLRPDDTIARLGGDEFAVLLESTSEGRALAIAAQILAMVRKPVSIEGRSIASDASVGVAMSTGGDTPESLLRNADLAMYAAKDRGKGNVQLFESAMHATVLQRLTLDAELREAIDERQFALAYQPIVSLVSGRLRGFEALLRWNHPTRGVILPSTFVPLAESTGLIVPLGRWVLREACRQARIWRRLHSGGEELTMSVNLSVRQLQDSEILAVIAAALADAGLPACRLQLEITESVLDHGGQTHAILERLHATGIRLALDDFGSGYSLSRLHSLPIDEIKIDKSFIDDLAGGGPAPLVAATIAMAHSLGLQTVAEGVETSAQLPFLRHHGCDKVQGFLFGRPLAAAAIDALLSQRASDRSWTNIGKAPAGQAAGGVRCGPQSPLEPALR